MSPGKTTLILLALALALGGWVVYDMNHKPVLDEENFAWPLLKEFPVKDVARIEVTRDVEHPTGPATRETLVFERTGNAWRMTQPLQGEADAHKVAGLLDLGTAMWPSNMIEAGKDAAQMEQYGLGAHAIRLALIHPKGQGVILVGKVSGLYNRVYAMKEGDARIGLMDPGFASPLKAAPERYLAKPAAPGTAPSPESAPELPGVPDFMKSDAGGN